MSFHEWLFDISSQVWPSAANHLLQTTLVCGLAMVAILFLSRESARARYAVWIIISLKFALPSAVLVALFDMDGLSLRSLAPQIVPIKDSAPIGIDFFDLAELPTTAHSGQTHNEIYCLLTLVWLAGFAFVLTRWLRRRAEFSRLLCSSPVVAMDRELAALRRVTGWLRASPEIELIVARDVVEPGVWRIFRPVIVLPENISGQLSDAELESVLMHEVIHIQRRDNLVASLQMILCSIFWFHPLIWIIDRRMLSDRERACDQEVCRLGGQSAVYATSLLKVLRFCIGFRMAGVSSAVDSNLKRRIEEIMNNQAEKRSKALQRAFVVTVALAVMLFSVAAGVLSRDPSFAQQGSNRQEGARGRIESVIPPGPMTESVSYLITTQSETLYEDLKNAGEISLTFDNNEQPPVIITDARMKAVKASSVYKRMGDDRIYWGDLYAVHASLTLVNNSSKRVKKVSLVFSCDKAGDTGHLMVHPLIEPGATEIGRSELTALGDPSSFSVRMGEVVFEDGEVWPKYLPAGTVITGPPLAPPPPPLERRKPTGR